MRSKISYKLIVIFLLISLFTVFITVGASILFVQQETSSRRVTVLEANQTNNSVDILRIVAINLGSWFIEMILVFIFIKKILKPLEELTRTIETNSKENLDLISFTQSKNEVGKIAAALNQHFQQCEHCKQDMEQLVTSRTQQLQLELEEEKKMNELMVNREIMMEQLKAEVKRLKGME